MSLELKKTALHAKHVQLGARMVPFAGFEMPVRYGSLTDEHMAVRNSVGLFDVSHMGEFFISGPKSLDLIQRICSNDASRMKIGQAQYTCMPNYQGGIVDDLVMYRLEEEAYMIVANASNMEKDWNWIEQHNQSFGAEIRDHSDEISLLAVQGPKAAALLQDLTSINLSEIPYYTFVRGEMAGVSDVMISATGYTGSGGFELYVNNEFAGDLWDAILREKDRVEVLPAGLGARDTLRLEMGFCLYGHDIDETTSPLEAGLGWITKFNHDFINREQLLTEKEAELQKKLVGFELMDRGIPREGYELLNNEGELIGRVTSGTMSPCLEKGIGMGYINAPYFKLGTEILVQIRKKQIPAVVVKRPFYKSS